LPNGYEDVYRSRKGIINHDKYIINNGLTSLANRVKFQTHLSKLLKKSALEKPLLYYLLFWIISNK
jgi:PleD family two-component response regulator